MKDFKKKNTIKEILKKSTLIHILFKQYYVLILFNLILISSCSNPSKKDNINICSTTNLPCLYSTEYVLLITNRGNIKLELYGELAPITVGNFIDFVENGFYDRTFFNRVIKQPYPFIIRGGDNSLKKGENKFIDINTGKIRYIPLEIKIKTNNLPTYGKVIDVSYPKNNIELKHKRSFLSMARSKKLNSANSQFHILLKNSPELDGRFAVFGKVINGMNVVDLIQEEDLIIEAKRL